MTYVQDVLSRYSGQRGRFYQETLCAAPQEMYDSISRLRASKLTGVEAEDSVFEYGVGLGYNLSALNCASKAGYDVADFLLPVLTERNITFFSSVERIGTHQFDVVICHHVLEHVVDPWHVLEEIKLLLRSGGRLLLFVPFEKERQYRNYNSRDNNGHLYSWNVQTLGALLTSSGFSLESIGLRPFGYDRFAAVVAKRLGLGELGFRFIRASLLLLRPRYEISAVVSKNS